MKLYRIIIGIAVAAMMFSGCEKEPKGSGKSGYKQDKPVSERQVYVAGYWWSNDQYLACYWLNGRRYDLNDFYDYQSELNGIFVDDDGTVYAYGFLGGNSMAAYWKNGEEIVLSEEYLDGQIKKLYKIDGHFLMVGEDNSRGCIWVDGKKITFRDEIWTAVWAAAKTDDGYYLTGHRVLDIDMDTGKTDVEYLAWKMKDLNSTPEPIEATLNTPVKMLVYHDKILYGLSGGRLYNMADGSSVENLGFWINDFCFDKDGKMVCAGYTTDSDTEYKGVVTRDGVVQEQFDTTVYSKKGKILNVFCYANDIYVCGYCVDDNRNEIPKYWGPDGTATDLKEFNGAKTFTNMTGIYVW